MRLGVLLGLLAAAAVLAAAAGARSKPPPAYAKVDGRTTQLAQSSYCWGSLCVDYLHRGCGARGVPTIRVRRGRPVVFRLGVAPRSVHLSVGGRDYPLKPVRNPTWTALRERDLHLFVTTAEGDTSYVACVRFT